MFRARPDHARAGTAALLAATLALHAGAAHAQSAARPTSTRPSSAAPAPRAAGAATVTIDTTPVAVVLLHDDVIALVGQATTHLMAAGGTLAQGRSMAASRELSAAAANLRVQAGVAEGTSKSDLLDAARDVDAISLQVRMGQIRTRRQLDDALRRTDHVLARHHWERAAKAWGRRDAERTGMELRAAANATERVARTAGQDAETAAKEAVGGARVASEKLVEGADWTADEVGRGITDLGRVIERLGRDVEPRRR
jgi:hypothetical protein